MEYVWKIVMSNGKEYLILDETKKPADFVTKYFKGNIVCDFKLVNPNPIPIVSGEYTMNHVLVRGSDISSVEYKGE